MSFIKARSTATRRDQLLTAGELAILEKGFAATSIEELITEVGISKGGFFYHFPDKVALVKAILERHLQAEDVWLDDLFAEAEAGGGDLLAQHLRFLDLLYDHMRRLPDVHPGCLIAACCFQEMLFDSEVRDLAAANLLSWRTRFETRLRMIAKTHPPRLPVDLQALADMLVVQIDGAIIFSKTIRDPKALARQVALHAEFVKVVFGVPGDRALEKPA